MPNAVQHLDVEEAVLANRVGELIAYLTHVCDDTPIPLGSSTSVHGVKRLHIPSNAPGGTNVLSNTGVVENAILIGLSKESRELYLAFDEEWNRLPPKVSAQNQSLKSRQDLWRFAGLHVRFYIKDKAENSSIIQFVRYEWESPRTGKLPAGLAENDDDEIFIFDGHGAAHPHFHIDPYILIQPSQHSTISKFATLSEEETGPGFIGSTTIEPRFTAAHIHVPLRANWQEHSLRTRGGWADLTHTDPLPHQHTPQSTTELTNWLQWAITYTLHQFELYL